MEYICCFCCSKRKNLISLRTHELKCPSNPNRIYNSYTTGKQAWNKGLTKDTDVRVLKNSINLSKSIKQNGRCTIQEYVGSLSGNVTVIFPPIVNLYVISNQVTANGYTFTVSTGIPGGTDAIIPAGQQATLVCDGINFLNANTVQAGGTAIQLIDGTVSSPSLSFGSEPSTGVYRPGIGEFGITVLGNEIVNVDANGITVDGSGTFTGGIAGGLFT